MLAVITPNSHGAELPSGERGFKTVSIFFKTYCQNCHAPEKKKGKITLHDIDPDMVAGVDDAKWQNILDQISVGDMPPEEEEKQPTAAMRNQIAAWINSELNRAGKGYDTDDFAHGNRVDHDELFSGKHKGPAYSPARLWRISPYISDGRYKDRKQLGKHLNSASQPFGLGDEPGVRDYATRYRIDGPTLELLLLNADELVKNQIGLSPENLAAMDKAYVERITNSKTLDEKKKKAALRKKPSGNFMRWANKDVNAFAYSKELPGTPKSSEMETIIRSQYQIAMTRQPTADELKRTMKLFEQSVREGGNLEGVRAVLTAILMAPEAIYRMELGLGKKTSDGRRMLSSMELAFALSYALRDVGPDKELLADAQSGALTNRETIAAHVERMVDEEMHGNYRRTQAMRILRFFQEFFGYTTAPTVFKDGSRHSGYSPRPESLVEDTDNLIRYILKQDKDVLKELLTTNKVMAVYAKAKAFRRTTIPYGISEKALAASGDGDNQVRGKHPGWRWLVEMPKNERAGILTQPSWLTAHSQNFDNDPIIRGKWIRQRLLAGVIPNVPITVDAVVPADHDKSLRQRLEKTKAESCWGCHQKMNPLGMAFEMYDDVGRFRKTELLRDNKTTVPVVSHGEITATGEPKLDGKVTDAIDLMNKLANSKRVRQSFVRHAFRYWMGRNETLDDSPTLMAADRAYVDSGGSFKALVVSLLTSDSFLYRK